jgi:hypothetical protein
MNKELKCSRCHKIICVIVEEKYWDIEGYVMCLNCREECNRKSSGYANDYLTEK